MSDLTPRDMEALSAYLDNQLPPAEKARLDQAMELRPELRLALDELAETRALLRSAPRYRAPRNFTLTPAMAAQARPQRRMWNPLSGFRLSAALSALSILAALGLQFLPGLSRGAPPMLAAAPISESGRAMDQAATPVILWGNNTGTGGGMQESSPSGGIVTYAQPQVIPPAGAGGDGNTYPFATGKGGGGGAVGMGGGGGGGDSLPFGSLSLPPEAVAPSGEQPTAVAINPDIQGGGPILGLPSADQAGQIIEKSAPAVELPAPETANPAPPAGLDARQIVAIALGGLGLLAALAAYGFWRRSRA